MYLVVLSVTPLVEMEKGLFLLRSCCESQGHSRLWPRAQPRTYRPAAIARRTRVTI